MELNGLSRLDWIGSLGSFGWLIQPDSAIHNSIFLSHKISQPSSQQYFSLTQNQPSSQPASRTRPLFVTLQNTNKCSGAVAGERQLHYLRTQSSSYLLFLFLSFYLYPRYPWSCYPFHSSLPQGASSLSHHHLPHLAMNLTLAL